MSTNLDNIDALKPVNELLDTLEFLPEIYFESDKNFKVTYTNRAGFEKFGYDKEDFNRGIHVNDFFSLKNLGNIKNNFNKIIKGEFVEPAEYILKKKDGSQFWGRIHSKPIIKDGKSIGLKGIIIDM